MLIALYFRLTVAAAALVALGGPALAGGTAAEPTTADDAAAVTIDPRQFIVPDVSDDARKFMSKKPGENSPAFSTPQIDLGASQLSLETDRDAIDSGPRVGIEKIDPTVLNPNLPQQKESPLQPYVGFKLSTPMQ
jgi:hypothetical protein